MVVAGGAGKDAAVGGGPVLLFVRGVEVSGDDAALGAGEGLMGTGRNPGRALTPGVLELAADDQAEDVGGVVEDGDVFGAADFGQLAQGLGEEEEALAEDDHPRRYLLDQVDALLQVEVVHILREGEVVQGDMVSGVEAKGGATVLDAATEDADGVVADVAARSRRVDDYCVAAAQVAKGDRRIGSVTADRPHVGLAG